MSYTQDVQDLLSQDPLFLQAVAVAGAVTVGQDPKALTPIGGGAGPSSTTSLVTCRSNRRASTSSIRWIVPRVCVWIGGRVLQAEEIWEGS